MLSFGAPGTRIFSLKSDSSNTSRRRLALRLLLSKPWQAKHLSDIIGLISRLKRMRSSADNPIEIKRLEAKRIKTRKVFTTQKIKI